MLPARPALGASDAAPRPSIDPESFAASEGKSSEAGQSSRVLRTEDEPPASAEKAGVPEDTAEETRLDQLLSNLMSPPKAAAGQTGASGKRGSETEPATTRVAHQRVSQGPCPRASHHQTAGRIEGAART